MVRQRAAWLIVAVVAGAWLGGCVENPAAPGQSEFEWGINPTIITVQQGASGTAAIRLNSKVNINSNVDFSVSGTVPNATVTVAPRQLGSTGRDAGISVQTSAQTPAGSYTLNITATEIGYGATPFLFGWTSSAERRRRPISCLKSRRLSSRSRTGDSPDRRSCTTSGRGTILPEPSTSS